MPKYLKVFVEWKKCKACDKYNSIRQYIPWAKPVFACEFLFHADKYRYKREANKQNPSSTLVCLKVTVVICKLQQQHLHLVRVIPEVWAK